MFLVFIFFIPAILVTLVFLCYLFIGSKLLSNLGIRLLEVVTIIGLTALFFCFDLGRNDCCSDETTIFSPDHRPGIYLLIGACTLAYFYSAYRKRIASPVVEVLVNIFLLLGIVFNILILVHDASLISWIGNWPILVLFVVRLSENHKQFLLHKTKTANDIVGTWQKNAWRVLDLPLFKKIPILLLLCMPVLFILSSFLMLFGQQPDSAIRAFTDTYKHTFSMLDHECENVQCGGHFLCSVAANGHRKFVKPVRYGKRDGARIVCNRQLLISNAFEELVQQKMPRAHKVIRRNYNKVGDVIHRHYGLFSNKYVSDIVYVLMKPLEWLFVLTLYTFDRHPENRIARQYTK